MTQKNCWLSNFNKEYINADFNHSGKRIHKKKIEVKKVVYKGTNRKFDIGKKDCENANNARNRDSFSVTKSNNMLKYDFKKIEEGCIQNKSTNLRETEDTLIEILDIRKKLTNIKK